MNHWKRYWFQRCNTQYLVVLPNLLKAVALLFTVCLLHRQVKPLTPTSACWHIASSRDKDEVNKSRSHQAIKARVDITGCVYALRTVCTVLASTSTIILPPGRDKRANQSMDGQMLKKGRSSADILWLDGLFMISLRSIRLYWFSRDEAVFVMRRVKTRRAEMTENPSLRSKQDTTVENKGPAFKVLLK